jgi:uncharacterized protein (DUF1501 family)
MKRRDFLKIFPAASVTPVVVNGFQMRPFANSKMARILSACEDVENRVLILIQLKGGNDGLNMLVPVQQYDLYAALRPSIRIPEAGANKYIELDSALPTPARVGLHPIMTGLKEMYDNGWVNVVQGVGYADMNGSHFKGTDIWLSGGDGTADNSNLTTGWMGRALQAMYPDVQGIPTTEMPDPLGIQVGDPNPSLGFHTDTQHQNVLNLSGQDPAGFYSLIQTIGGAPLLNVPDTEYGDEIQYIQGIENALSLYAQRISDAFNAGSNAIASYPQTGLANQLKTIARLIKGGLKTKVYLCSMGGYDTHGAQVFENVTTSGNHANLLKEFADSVNTFFKDLDQLGIGDQVAACTFSEFGRCARENGSLGTDHGTLAPMFVFGKNIQAGVSGNNPNLGVLTQDNQLTDMQHDYRQVFTTLLQDWLGANNFVLEQTMFQGYNKIPAVDPAAVVTPDCYIGGTVSVFDPFARKRPLTVFPNPAVHTTEVSFQSNESFDARLSLHSLGGSLVSAKMVRVQSGANFYLMDVASLPAGTYFVRLENKYSGKAEVVKLSVAR